MDGMEVYDAMSVEIQTPQMSVSDNSTVTPFRDNEDSLEMLDGCDGDTGDLLMNSYGKSPYADTQMVSLDVGPDATRFEIHGSILCQSTELAVKVDLWGLKKQAVALPELDEAAAHTLVHYLYTGRYQTLSPVATQEKSVSLGYKLGICVYCAAVCYKLPGLAELAKEKITSFGEDVSISNVLAMARDHAFPRLPEDETWYPAYLEGVIDSAMAEDPQSFQKPDFIIQVAGNSRLLQVVWKTVTSNFARATVAKDVSSKEDSTPMISAPEPDVVAAEPEPVEVQGLETTVDEIELGHAAPGSGTVPEVDVEDFQPISQSPNAYVPEPETVQEPSIASLPVDVETHLDEQTEATADDFETTFEDSLGMDAIEPTVQLLPAPEQSTDEVGFESSKMDSQMGSNSSMETTAKEPTKPSHARTDSFMQVEEVVPCLEKEDDEAAEVMETSLPTDPGSDEASGAPTGTSSSAKTSRKNKKHKKKKSSIVF